MIYEYGSVLDSYGKPPVMPWAVMVVDRRDRDDGFLNLAYGRFVRYERHWARDRGGDEHGLFHYDSHSPDAEERLIQAKWESGWDDSVRWDAGIYEVWPIDLNCFMVMVYRSLATMAERLSLPADGRKWQERERGLADRINDRLYDEESHAYLDYDFSRQSFVQALTPASFMPLYVGIVTAERAERMARLAADPDKFHPGWPTVSYDHPCYANDSFCHLVGLPLQKLRGRSVEETRLAVVYPSIQTDALSCVRKKRPEPLQRTFSFELKSGRKSSMLCWLRAQQDKTGRVERVNGYIHPFG